MYEETTNSTVTEVATTVNSDIYEEVRQINESLNGMSGQIDTLCSILLLIFVTILLIFVFRFLFGNLMSWFGD